MFQRIKGAIDRTIAEEQARQQKALEVGSSANRSASTSSRRNEKSRPKNAGSDAGDAAPNPDPAVFEAAFVIDDSDEPSRVGTPKPAPPEKDAPNGEPTGQAEDGENSNPNADAKDGSSGDGHAAGDGAKPVLTPELRQKLRKLEKLESTYPELLRSYRVAHRRATAIEPFEKALRENTPLTSIGDPEALVEYLNQLKLKGDMVMEELKRVTSDRDEFKRKSLESEKKSRESEKKATKLQEEVDALKAEKEKEAEKPKPGATAAAKGESGGDGEDFFSYDDEIPQLQAEIASEMEEIDSLKSERDSLKEQLSSLKQNGAGLAEGSEKSALELSESREASASQDSLQTQLEAQKTEIADLTDRLDKSDKQSKQLQDQLEAEKKQAVSKAQDAEALLGKAVIQASELADELSKAIVARSVSKTLIVELNSQVDNLKKEKSGIQSKLDEATKKLEGVAKQPSAPVEPPSTLAPPTTGGGGNKKKKKKGRGGGGAASPAPPASPSTAVAPGTASAPDADHGADASALEAEIASLKEELASKDQEIERLIKKRKAEEDLREEIQTLRENLINIGQDHVEDKARIKELGMEKAELKEEINVLMAKIVSLATDSGASAKHLEKMQALQKEYDSLVETFVALQAEQNAARQLSQSRFKELTELREALLNVEIELKTLRKDSAEFKIAREELEEKNKEINNLAKKAKGLERDLADARQEISARTSEIGILKGRLAVETEEKAKLEETHRASGRDLRRAVAEQIDLSAKLEKLGRELQKSQEELSKALSRAAELETQSHKLRREKAAAQEEAEFKTKQYSTNQGLLSSMRDQVAEMTTQLREEESKVKALEDEIAETQHHLQERSRDNDTMRRLLAEAQQGAEVKLREMRNRVETITSERERVEEDTSAVVRKHVKQTAELKSRVRELEEQIKDLHTEKGDLEERERTWRRRREELEAVELRTEGEANELRNAVSSLRAALDASELQVRDGEKAKTNLRKEYDSLQLLHDKISKELKAAQTKAAATASGVGQSGASSGVSTSRTSVDSTRTSGGAEITDMMYLKTIMLQFLEQKDTRLRAQLVPVLGRILKFDKSDEKKWLSAVQHIEVR